MRVHDLRHTAASLMLARGESLFAVSRWLGHSTITLTANTYGHLASDRLAGIADRMQELFDRKPDAAQLG